MVLSFHFCLPGFLSTPILSRLWFSGIKRVGATGAPSSACSGRLTTRLSSRCEVVTGSVVIRERAASRTLVPLCLTTVCFYYLSVHLDLSPLSLISIMRFRTNSLDLFILSLSLTRQLPSLSSSITLGFHFLAVNSIFLFAPIPHSLLIPPFGLLPCRFSDILP